MTLEIVYALLSALFALVQGLQSVIQAGARQTTLLQVAGEVQTNTTLLEDPTTGLAGLLTAIDNLSTQLTTTESTLATAIGTPQQAGSPVTLPAVPPAGYGGASASDVWNYPDAVTGDSVLVDLSIASIGVRALDWSDLRYAATNFPFLLSGPWSATVTPPSLTYPTLDLATVSPPQTLIQALTAQNPGFALFSSDASDTWLYAVDPTASSFLWMVGMSSEEFAILTGQAVTPVNASPVWPGIAKVTLGTAVALSDGLSVTGPMDGVIVKITAVPYPIGYYPFGSRKSYVHVGAIVFVDDNGEAAQAIPLGLDDEVIPANSMEQATSAVIRLKSGVVGTVQPWTIT